MIINEGLLVRNHVRVINACQDAHFIYCVFFVFVAHRAYLCLLKSVDLVICQSFDLVYAAISTITELTLYCKVF